jgi:hypothetical protein
MVLGLVSGPGACLGKLLSCWLDAALGLGDVALCCVAGVIRCVDAVAF